MTSAWKPDPAKGVFETLLLVDGEPVELDAHLDRLRKSLAEVYDAKLPAEAGDRVRAGAADFELGRLRLTARPKQRDVELDVAAQSLDPAIVFPPESRGASLRQVLRRGGHGPHKWVERPGMERPREGTGQLICDGEELLEAGWANLFIVREETLWTPPLDGRILAGTARAAVLAIARDEGIEVHERPLHRGDLIVAAEVFLTNSVRGVEPALALGGAPLAGCGPLSRRLAAALRRRWGLPDAADALPTPATEPPLGQPAR
jgi:para-aminobenzoate synthetase/4-amino-4-deoxychorismate lyase